LEEEATLPGETSSTLPIRPPVIGSKTAVKAGDFVGRDFVGGLGFGLGTTFEAPLDFLCRFEPSRATPSQ
jgi:hypothetical protein